MLLTGAGILSSKNAKTVLAESHCSLLRTLGVLRGEYLSRKPTLFESSQLPKPMLRPFDFFPRNPMLDLPATP